MKKNMKKLNINKYRAHTYICIFRFDWNHLFRVYSIYTVLLVGLIFFTANISDFIDTVPHQVCHLPINLSPVFEYNFKKLYMQCSTIVKVWNGTMVKLWIKNKYSKIKISYTYTLLWRTCGDVHQLNEKIIYCFFLKLLLHFF